MGQTVVSVVSSDIMNGQFLLKILKYCKKLLFYTAEKLQENLHFQNKNFKCPKYKRKCPRTAMLQEQILDYVMCDSEGLFEPLKGHKTGFND